MQENLFARQLSQQCPSSYGAQTVKEKYFNSYFQRFEHIWTHGDFIMIHPVTKQVFMLGRADGLRNPSGVRFGSVEIYSVIEAFFSDVIADSICVGQRRPLDQDETVILFLLMKPGRTLSRSLIENIQTTIWKERSPWHVPRYIFETPEIPASTLHQGR